MTKKEILEKRQEIEDPWWFISNGKTSTASKAATKRNKLKKKNFDCLNPTILWL